MDDATIYFILLLFPGSDIGGSIRMPCFFNGIFGHKPSKYIVSIKGQYPEPSSEMQHSFLGKNYHLRPLNLKLLDRLKTDQIIACSIAVSSNDCYLFRYWTHDKICS